MRENKTKAKLAAGEKAIGTMVFEFNTTGIGQIVAQAGADFVIYDMEHTGWSIETIRMLMATTRAADITPMVRVPATQYHLMSRPLDVGAMGLMIPMVESEEQARLIVQSAKYFPEGSRGAAFTVAHDDYEGGAPPDKMASANKEGMLIAQIETVDGLENAEKIAATDGIDCLWVGHFDLSISMGIPAQFDHPDFVEAIKHVADVATKHGKSAGVMVPNKEQYELWSGLGYRAFAWNGDLWIYGAALKAGIDSIR